MGEAITSWVDLCETCLDIGYKSMRCKFLEGKGMDGLNVVCLESTKAKQCILRLIHYRPQNSLQKGW